MPNLSDDDVFTLIGHAEYLRLVKGQNDMPVYFLGLAERIALTIGDAGLAERCKEIAERSHPVESPKE